ncbi:MAG: S-layer homology domain-containing protein [Bacillota bacterium]
MRVKLRYHLIILCLFLLLGFSQAAFGDNTIGIYPPQPMDMIVMVSKPSISIQLVLNGNTIESIDMKLNGSKVEAKYDTDLQRVVYTPKEPLQAGKYKVNLSVALKGWSNKIEKDWQFTVGENAVGDLAGPTEEQKKAMEYGNQYRKYLGLPLFKMNDALNAATSAHSNYIMINKQPGHEEYSNNKGYVGKTPADRMAAFGYGGSLSAENVSFGQESYSKSIDGLIDAPYHRLSWINPFYNDFGYGRKEKYFTFNFGSMKFGADKLVVYPKDSQTQVSTTWDGNETPNPLRIHNKSGNVGYPITVTYYTEKVIESFVVEKTVLTNGKGAAVSTLVNTSQNDSELKDEKNSVFIIPANPLNPGEKYTVTVKGKITFEDKSVQSVDKTWSFTTAASAKEVNGWMGQVQQAGAFEDIGDHWAVNDINELANLNVVTAKVDSFFKPDDKITRAEFADFVIRALGIELKPFEGILKDVKAETDKAQSIEAAFRAGIVKGVGNGNFAPENLIKREEIATMIMNAFSIKGNLELIKTLPDLVYKDTEEISSWAVENIKATYQLGIMKGRPGNIFGPKDNATRAEGAVMVKNLLEKL